MHSLWNALNRISLIKQILVGLIIGIAVAMAFPAAGKELALLGVIFVGALKGIAPVLVFVLVAAALSRKQEDHESNIKDVIILYLIGFSGFLRRHDQFRLPADAAARRIGCQQ